MGSPVESQSFPPVSVSSASLALGRGAFEAHLSSYLGLELELEENLKHSRVKLMIKLEKHIWRISLFYLIKDCMKCCCRVTTILRGGQGEHRQEYVGFTVITGALSPRCCQCVLEFLLRDYAEAGFQST